MLGFDDVIQLHKEDATNVFEDLDNRWRLFPGDRIFINWEPFRASIKSNYDLIFNYTDVILCTPQKSGSSLFPRCNSMSFATVVQAKIGFRYVMDYYGNDAMDAAAHICRHLQHMW